MNGFPPGTYDQDLEKLLQGQGPDSNQQSQPLEWSDNDDDVPEPPATAATRAPAPKPGLLRTAGSGFKGRTARCRKTRAGKSLGVSRFVVNKDGRIVLRHPPARLCTGRKGAPVLAPATKADFKQFATLFKP